MWYFVSPQVVFGEGALDALDQITGKHALIITDKELVRIGLADMIKTRLAKSGFVVHIFDSVEPEPSFDTVRAGALMAQETGPDWIIGLGGGSPMDAAKAVRVLHERPDLGPGDINPFMTLNMRQKARLITIPTTSGTGAESTWAIVLKDHVEKRKLGLGNREAVANIAIVDPQMAKSMSPRLTADTGLDALTHAIEGYACTWQTDITDGLCLKAARLIFDNLPRAVEKGSDMEARERMHNAATCAGLGFGNAMASMAHAIGHTLGAVFDIPHGRAVSTTLPYTIEFAARRQPDRFADMAAFLGLSSDNGEQAARTLAVRVRDLIRHVGNPASLSETGIDKGAFEAHLDKLVDDAFNDTQMVTCRRHPSYEELRNILIYAYEGQSIDF